jgi:hypothetical protein
MPELALAKQANQHLSAFHPLKCWRPPAASHYLVSPELSVQELWTGQVFWVDRS